MKKLVRNLLVSAAVLTALSAQDVSAAVIFEDNFDDQPDWAPNCMQCGRNENGYNGGGEASGTPANWDFWRNDELWNPYSGSTATAGSHPTMEVTDDQHSGPVGKSLVVWNESNAGASGDGWGADAQLAKYLGGNHREIYLQLKLKMSPDFRFQFDTSNAAQIKLARFFHSDNLNAPFSAFTGGSQAPLALMKLHQKFYGGFGYDFQHRCDPQSSNYYCAVNYDGQAKDFGGNSAWYGSPSFAQWTTGGVSGDGWHTLKWYGKLNSAPGASDGIIRFWQNGTLMYERTDVQWIGATGNISSGWNVVSVGGNAFNPYADPVQRAEQWYAIDDVIISTTPITTDYLIGAGDTVAPVVAITSPSNGATVTGTVSVAANATDNVAVSRVDFYVDGSLVSSDATQPHNCSITTTTLTNGQHQVMAQAYDAAGNMGKTSMGVNVNNPAPDTAAPSVSLSAPSVGAVLSGSATISANAADNVGVTRVDFLLDGITRASVNVSPFSFTLNTTAEANGSHTLQAMAYDAAGNAGQSAALTVKVANDATAPSVAITSPADGTKVSGITGVTASATDNVGISKVEYYINGVLRATESTAPYTWYWDTRNSANAAYAFTAKAYDAAGNVGTSSSVTVNVLNDSFAPAIVSFVMPAAKNSTNVEVTAFSANDDVAVAGYLITESATVPSPSASGWTASAPGSFTFSGTGSRTAYAWAKDAAGRVSAASTANVIIDTVLPVISSMTLAAGADSVTLHASGTDNVAVAKMQVYVNSVLQLETTQTSISHIIFPTSRSQQVTVKVHDSAGNIRSRSLKFTKS